MKIRRLVISGIVSSRDETMEALMSLLLLREALTTASCFP